ncbi:bacillithiol system redox-active protein YtxJ [Aureitalea marina]|nr:bacillithiol system redox-active protein YtxJ [Aureitalea marina]
MFKWFGSSKDSSEAKPTLNWQELTEIEQLDQVETDSQEKPVVLFKHSTRCGISRMALNQFERSFSPEKNYGLFYLNLIAHRDISNLVASRFQVYHESPQVLVIHQGKTIYHASHGQIMGDHIAELVNQLV